MNLPFADLQSILGACNQSFQRSQLDLSAFGEFIASFYVGRCPFCKKLPKYIFDGHVLGSIFDLNCVKISSPRAPLLLGAMMSSLPGFSAVHLSAAPNWAERDHNKASSSPCVAPCSPLPPLSALSSSTSAPQLAVR